METATASRIDGGVITVFTADMNRSVEFYTQTLGLNLVFRAGDHWASIDAGKGFMLGLHPAGPHSPTPGVNGGLQIGLNVTGPLEPLMETLGARGVKFNGEIVNDEQGGIRLAFFNDPDGNEVYLCESKW